MTPSFPTRRSSELLEDYLSGDGLTEAVLTMSDGTQRSGEHLRAMLETARDVRRLMSPLTNHLPNPTVVGQAAIAGALDPALLSDAGNAQGAADYIARRLDALVPALERGWQGRFDEERGSLVFERTLRAILEDRKSTRLNSSH